MIILTQQHGDQDYWLDEITSSFSLRLSYSSLIHKYILIHIIMTVECCRMSVKDKIKINIGLKLHRIIIGKMTIIKWGNNIQKLSINQMNLSHDVTYNLI